jgi:hypothetical protein
MHPTASWLAPKGDDGRFDFPRQLSKAGIAALTEQSAVLAQAPLGSPRTNLLLKCNILANRRAVSPLMRAHHGPPYALLEAS